MNTDKRNKTRRAKRVTRQIVIFFPLSARQGDVMDGGGRDTKITRPMLENVIVCIYSSLVHEYHMF